MYNEIKGGSKVNNMKRLISFSLIIALVFTILPFNIIESYALTTPKTAAVNTSSGVKVSWNAISSAKGYYVYRKTGSGKYNKIKTLTSTSYTDSTAKSGTTYTYAVRAYNSSSLSSYKEKTILYLEAPILSLTNTTKSCVVKWDAVSGAKGYYLYKKTGTGSYKLISTQTSRSYTDTNVKNNTKYTYAVRAYNGSVKGSYIGKSILFLDYPKVTVANAATGATVSWAAITGAKGYYIYKKTDDGSYSKIATTTALTYTDTDVKDGTKYTYCARAYYGTSMSSYAGKSLIRLSNPSISVVNDTSAVRVSWPKISGAEGYYVYRKLYGGSYTKIASVSGASYTDTDVSSGSKYTYTVRAYKGSCLSSFTGKSIVHLPATTASVSATDNGAVLKWTAIKGASGYNIYRKTDSAAYEKIATVTSTSYTDTEIVFGATTQYKVLAYKESYEGKSNIVSIKYTNNKNQRFEKQLLNAINDLRKSQNIEGEYVWSDELTECAAVRNSEIVEEYSHFRPDGEIWDEVLDDYDYLKCAEIIYKTPSSSSNPYTVVSLLKNDKAAKEIMLDEQYSEYGASIYYDENSGYYYISIIVVYQ